MKIDPPLEPASFVRRYKRFFADFELADGSIETGHCPNTGSMKSCLVAGSLCYFSRSDNPKRKLKTTLEYVTTHSGQLACINTQRANQIVKEALERGQIAELAGYQNIRAEVKYGEENSRIDFKLSDSKLRGISDNEIQPDCFVEVKSVTLAERGIASFPDSVTSRGQKHIRELMAMRAAGYRAVLFFCVQHQAINQVRIASEIDPDYASLLAQAMQKGVEVLAYQVELSPNNIAIGEALEFQI